MRETREEQAKREIGQTEISRGAARFLAVMFLGMTFGVPIVQHSIGLAQAGRGEPETVLDFYGEFGGVGGDMAEAWREARTFLRKFLAPNAVLLKGINTYQDELDDTCWLATGLRSPVQAVMCRLGVGNEKAFIGRDGWLFYEPGVSHLVGPGFLDPKQLKKRERAGNEWQKPPQPNPVTAIRDFARQLSARDIRLIVIPVPVKPSIHPEHLTRRAFDLQHAVRDPSWEEFILEVGEDVTILDCTPTILETMVEAPEAYLKTDTHWRPGVVEAVAGELAGVVRSEMNAQHPTSNAQRPSAERPRYERRKMTVRNLGDIAAMLKLPEGQTLYSEEEVTVSQVVKKDGALWESDEKAEVLLLGDSFSNIYSLEDMGWGTAAGLAEQLSCDLQMPVDRIVQNDSGAFATRETLAKELARGNDRLVNTKVVVWQFAARELSIGDWKFVDMKLGEKRTSKPPPPVAKGALVTATIVEVSNRPERNAVYKDFIMKLHTAEMTDESGAKFGQGDGIVHVFGMRKRVILPVAKVKKGMKLRMRLEPWQKVLKSYGTMKSGALSDEMLEIEKELYWCEEPEILGW